MLLASLVSTWRRSAEVTEHLCVSLSSSRTSTKSQNLFPLRVSGCTARPRAIIAIVSVKLAQSNMFSSFFQLLHIEHGKICRPDTNSFLLILLALFTRQAFWLQSYFGTSVDSGCLLYIIPHLYFRGSQTYAPHEVGSTDPSWIISRIEFFTIPLRQSYRQVEFQKLV